ncbi:hypothetical protein Plhal304r1_c059g0147081 [Plasmopara halstedii]
MSRQAEVHRFFTHFAKVRQLLQFCSSKSGKNVENLSRAYIEYNMPFIYSTSLIIVTGLHEP